MAPSAARARVSADEGVPQIGGVARHEQGHQNRQARDGTAGRPMVLERGSVATMHQLSVPEPVIRQPTVPKEGRRYFPSDQTRIRE